MSPARAEAQAEDARSALTRRSARSYLPPTSQPATAPVPRPQPRIHLSFEPSLRHRPGPARRPSALNPPTPVLGEPQKARHRCQPGEPSWGRDPAALQVDAVHATPVQTLIRSIFDRLLLRPTYLTVIWRVGYRMGAPPPVLCCEDVGTTRETRLQAAPAGGLRLGRVG